MFRSTILGSVLAAVFTPMGIFLNHAIMQAPRASIAQSDVQLSNSLSQLGQTLVSFEARQTGSEDAMAKQISMLTELVSKTTETSMSQVESLAKTIQEIKAATAKEDAAVRTMLNNFATNFEREVDAKFVKIVDDEESPPVPASKGVGTLDVRTIPSDSDLESIQTMSDAARRIIALEKEVAALKVRCATCNAPAASTTTSSPVYYQSYPSYSYSAPSGGCTGSYMPAGSYYTQQYSAPPQQQYSTQNCSNQPATYERRGLFGWRSSPVQSGTCRMINGQPVCN